MEFICNWKILANTIVYRLNMAMKSRFQVAASYIEFKVKIFCSWHIATILSFSKLFAQLKKRQP